MKLVKMTEFDTKWAKEINALYLIAFPANERKPIEAIYAQQKAGYSDVLAILNEENQFIGLLIIVKSPNLILIEYLAIDPAFQGKGYGSLVLKQVQQKYENYIICIEIEDTEILASNTDIRLQRLRFYERNGFNQLGIHISIFEVKMELLGSHTSLVFKDYINLYKQIHGEKITEKIYFLA